MIVILNASACLDAEVAGDHAYSNSNLMRRYLGQQNPTDMFTRLLASLVYTGIAPQSFYKDPNGPDRHYDGM